MPLQKALVLSPTPLHRLGVLSDIAANEIADTFVDICVEFTGGAAGMLW